MLTQKINLMIYIIKRMHLIKIDISREEFLSELDQEIKKNSMSKFYLKITGLTLNIFYKVRYFSQLLKKIKFFYLKDYQINIIS